MAISTFPAVAPAKGGYNFVPIANAALTGSTVTFSAIDAKYRALQLIITQSGGGTQIFGSNAALRLRVNGDTGQNYNYDGRRLVTTTWSQFASGGGTSDFIDISTTTAQEYRGMALFENTNVAAPTLITAAFRAGTGFNHIMYGDYALTTTISSVSVIGSASFTAGTAYLLGSE
jgi:hypothetical protein